MRMNPGWVKMAKAFIEKEGIMSKRTIGLVVIVIGVVIAVVALLLDVIGIGNKAGIGWMQLLGTAIGVVVALVGVWLAMSKPAQK